MPCPYSFPIAAIPVEIFGVPVHNELTLWSHPVLEEGMR